MGCPGESRKGILEETARLRAKNRETRVMAEPLTMKKLLAVRDAIIENTRGRDEEYVVFSLEPSEADKAVAKAAGFKMVGVEPIDTPPKVESTQK